MTEAQKRELWTLVAAWVLASPAEQSGIQEQLEAMIDGLGDERVVAFAQGALRASSPKMHIENTLAQYGKLDEPGWPIAK